MIICKICNAELRDKEQFLTHMKIIHNKVPAAICKICHKKFRDDDSFDRHLQFVHGTNHWDITLAMRKAKDEVDKLNDKHPPRS